MRLTRTAFEKVASQGTDLLPHAQLQNLTKKVSKGSNFLRIVKSQFLDEEVLIRQGKRKAKALEARYNVVRERLMSPVTLHAENSERYNTIVNLLKDITPKDLRSRAHANDFASYRALTRYNTKIYSDIPKVPAQFTAESFTEFIKKLTTYKYLVKNASKQSTGIVIPLLKFLFRKENDLAKHLRSIESYNMTIAYFLKFKDLEYARSLVTRMEEDFIMPNTFTYNAFLFDLSLPKSSYEVHPLDIVIGILATMRKKNLEANLTTWWMILRIAGGDRFFAKDFIKIYEKELELPVTPQFYTIKLNLAIESPTLEEMVEKANAFQEVNLDLNHVILRKALADNKINEGWKFVQEQGSKGGVNSTTLQIFLDKFQEMEAIQLSLGAFYTFLNRYQITPSSSNFHSLFAVTTKMGFHKNWRSMARIIYSEMVRLQGHERNKAGYWITRLKARALADHKNKLAPLDLTSPLKKEELDLVARIQREFLWDSDIVIHPSKSNDHRYKNLCKQVGTRQGKIGKRPKNPEFQTTTEDKARMEKYKSKVLSKNMSLHHLQKAKIVAKGSLKRLTDEMIARNRFDGAAQAGAVGVTTEVLDVEAKLLQKGNVEIDEIGAASRIRNETEKVR